MHANKRWFAVVIDVRDVVFPIVIVIDSRARIIAGRNGGDRIKWRRTGAKYGHAPDIACGWENIGRHDFRSASTRFSGAAQIVYRADGGPGLRKAIE